MTRTHALKLATILLICAFLTGCDNSASNTGDSGDAQSQIHPDAQHLDECPVSLSPRFEVHMQMMGQVSTPFIRFAGQSVGTPDEVWQFSFERETGPNDAVWQTDQYSLVFDKDQLQFLSNIELHHDAEEGYVFYEVEAPDTPATTP